ncbi:MAG TPA: ribosome biogenesis GTP-binding protein YihA/YsxC [Puia sp.]|jgi:GTP-binding protein|nr:ribosome biogenesis GTP-binding protein YihA/YsxC [Puia sp.]
MEIRSAKYVISSPSYKDCPETDLPEYAFIGRSNVGKSSLINMLTDIDKLAKTSAAPGKTQLINHFTIESIDEKRVVSKWWLVDLPGYGFAKVSLSQRKQWETMIEDFLKKRETLAHVFLLIDSRHEPQKLDLDFADRLGKWEIPFTLIFTKSDKENQRTVSANVKSFLKKMSEHWQFLPQHFVTSAEKKTGRTDILRLIGEMNEDWKKA